MDSHETLALGRQAVPHHCIPRLKTGMATFFLWFQCLFLYKKLSFLGEKSHEKHDLEARS